MVQEGPTYSLRLEKGNQGPATARTLPHPHGQFGGPAETDQPFLLGQPSGSGRPYHLQKTPALASCATPLTKEPQFQTSSRPLPSALRGAMSSLWPTLEGGKQKVSSQSSYVSLKINAACQTWGGGAKAESLQDWRPSLRFPGTRWNRASLAFKFLPH